MSFCREFDGFEDHDISFKSLQYAQSCAEVFKLFWKFR